MATKLFMAAAFSIFFSYCGNNENAKTESVTTDTKEASNKEATESKFTYDLAKPSKTWTLPKALKEVSGNSWVDEKHLLVIEDIHPILYLIALDKDATIEKTIPFEITDKGKFDIEDVAVEGNTAYALWSHGTIYKIDGWKTTPKVTQWETELDKKNNTEGLCLDPVSHNLLVACKNKPGDDGEKKSTRTIYMFDVASGKLKEDPFLLIEKKDFKKLEDESFDFYPSAVAVHPVTHDVYVLSTKETKGMAQYSYDGKLKNFQFIDKELMPQPEGICFSPKGTLYISSEGKHGDPPQILEFKTTE